jgi:hypothetical protein
MRMRGSLPLLLVALTSATAGAQTPAPLHAAIERHAKTVSGTGREAVPQTDPGSSLTGQRSWVMRHPVLTGTLMGLGIGVPVGIATCRYPTAEGSSCSDYTFPGNARMLGAVTIGAFGAGLGAAVGALVAAVAR